MNETSARILIVEDSDVQALELRATLEANGYAVTRAASAEAAMDMLARDVPDLIVADYQLPSMSGGELTRQLRLNEQTRAVPVLMITSDVTAGERVGLESGADAYVQKSRDPQALLMRVNALLRGRRHERKDTGGGFRRGSLIVLDSSATGRLHLQSLLARDGYLVTPAPRPQEAERLLREGGADCVVVNLLSADFDGVAACRTLDLLREKIVNETGRGHPFLIIGVGEGRASGEGLLQAAFEAGVDDVIATQADADLLRLRMRALVRRQLVADEAERLESERESARAAAEQFRVLVEGVTDYALYMLDPEGRVSTWNAGAERIKGYAADEVIGESFEIFYPEQDRAAGEPQRALAQARREGRYETEAQRLRKGGRLFWAHVIIDRILDDKGRLRGYAKITRDISEKRHVAEELQEARAALLQAQKMEAIGQLTGGIAHDFNNMLAGIIGALNLVRRRIASGRIDEAEKFIEAAHTSANRAAALTSRLLAFGRRQTLDIQPIDVNAVIASMRILLDRTMGENIHVETIFENEAEWASTDVNQLESAILNLAINARDAMSEDGQLTIATRRSADKPGMIEIVVRDTGVGMTPEILEKVFDPFFTTKPQGQGTGLGLSMVYGFVTQSGGSVDIDSKPGAGAAIRLRLPASAPATAEIKPAARMERQTKAAGEVVLVVEDDPQVRMLILEVLAELKYEAIEAATPEVALESLKSAARIDLMVSDVGLPGMNGRQLAAAARKLRPGLRILFITGYAAEAAVRNEFLEEGMDMLLKPFALDDLTQKIQEMIAARSAAR